MNKAELTSMLRDKWYADCLRYNIPVNPSDVQDIVEDLIETKESKERYYNGKS